MLLFFFLILFFILLFLGITIAFIEAKKINY
jgi:hypothetical protein